MSQRPVRVGIIGVHPDQGWAATSHIPALRQLPQFHIEAISHTQLDIAKAAAEKFGVPHAMDTSEALVAHPDVDLVVITVRVPQHRQLVTSAIEAGKAVFSEWPLATDLAQARALRDLAREKGIATFIGLQTRASPVFVHARNLVKDGYVGKVLSATVVGSGILWGEEISERFAYTLDRRNGASMLNVPFAHSIDGLLHVLDSPVATVTGLLGNARQSIRMAESGMDRELSVPDQIHFSCKLGNGAFINAHFRGGLSRATNFHVEINGTRGDLIITSPVGYVGIGGMALQGARGEETLHALEIPHECGPDPDAQGPVQTLAIAYARLASDLRTGTQLSPTFDDAVTLHRLIDAVERSEGVPQPFDGSTDIGRPA
ncbi:oxidoreductase [Rhodanobacter sp. Root561]|uniref:Gfo/Idh/MocA family protein n=1 Tax=Rhodanobacter sp. Root561 TaxID=1736560 RepID=UPI0006F9B431|nr:Gfo/Idh/MocA family oxidoreductase [Rhodanobacter sp. Root561]KQZ69191.1 oxidoreductase [Rhodanobacter sp. Root561]